VAALFEVGRGPNTRHQHDSPKIDALRPYKDAIFQALRKASLEQITQLLNNSGVEISKPQLARAVQLFKKETRAERAGVPSPTAPPSTDPKLKQAAAELLRVAQGPNRRHPHPAPKQEQLRERREQLLRDREKGKTIPEIVQDLRRQGINISHAQALRIITLFQNEERTKPSHYAAPQPEPLAVHEDPPKANAPSSKPKAPITNKAREDALQETIRQSRRTAAKAPKTRLPPGDFERGKGGPSRPSPDR